MSKIVFGTMSLVTLGVGTALFLSAHAQETQSFDITPFSELKTAAGISVTYEQADDYSLTATFIKGDADNLKIKQDGDKLTLALQSKKKWGWNSGSTNIKVHVTGPGLTEATASSGSSLTITDLQTDDFEIDASSGATITISGTCNNLEAEASSGSSVSAVDFQCKTADVDASSGASIDVFASEEGRSDPSSGASVTIYGNPAVQEAEKSMSGGSTRFRD